MKTPVDVVIPAHDAANTVGDAVRSALRQTTPPASVTVVADACADDSARLARAAGARVVEVNARSVAVARNLGAAGGSAPWIAFLDADDLWRPSWLEEAARGAAGAPNAAVLYGTVEEWDERGRKVRRPERDLPHGDVFAALLTEGFITTSAVLVRRDAFDAVGGFNERFPRAGVEDWDLWLRLAAHYDFAPVLGWRVVYRRFPTSAMRSPERFLELRAASHQVVRRAMELRAVDGAVRRRALARVWRESAQRQLHHHHRRGGVVDALLALRQAPLDPRPWSLLAVGALPPPVARLAFSWRRHLQARRSAATAARSPRGAPIKIVHVITGLDAGGAEAMLVKLIGHLPKAEFSSQVVSLLDGGVNARRLREMGIPVHSLKMRAGRPDLRSLLHLTRWLKRCRPEVVQTWMYHADLLGGLAARAAGVPSLVWNVQNSCLPPHPSRATRAALRLSAGLAGELPDRIVVCSKSGARWHGAEGYPADKMVLIENGIDVDRFTPDEEARREVRTELGLREHDIAIGLTARFAPEKDHATFFAAIALLREAGRAIIPVLCGIDTERTNPALAALVSKHGLQGVARLLGRRDDMPRLLPALDIACLSSSHVEAFSNALGEAMAAGVPCVATDTGDNRRLLGDDSLIAPAKDPKRFAEALARVLDDDEAARKVRGASLRERAIRHFSLDSTIERYRALYFSLRPPPGPL